MPAPLTLEWSYTPADFFGAPAEYAVGSYTVHIENGRVVATFVTDQSDSVFSGVHNELEARFLGAQTIRNRPFHLSTLPLLRPQFRQLIASTVVLGVQFERFAVILDR